MRNSNPIMLIYMLLLCPIFVTSTSINKSFIMIKPEGVRDRVVGRIIQRFEDKGLKVNYAFIYFTMYFLTFSTSVECD
jgi:hypothetical protein